MLDLPAPRIAFRQDRRIRQLKTWRRAAEATAGTLIAFESLQLAPRVGEIARVEGALALTVGPQEWLIVTPTAEVQNSTRLLGSESHMDGSVVIELTDALAVLDVHGESARDLLSRGCGLDLHPRTFGVGRCARTRFAHIPLVLSCVDDVRRFELYVARSYAHYLCAWFVDAAPELVARP